MSNTTPVNESVLTFFKDDCCSLRGRCLDEKMPCGKDGTISIVSTTRPLLSLRRTLAVDFFRAMPLVLYQPVPKHVCVAQTLSLNLARSLTMCDVARVSIMTPFSFNFTDKRFHPPDQPSKLTWFPPRPPTRRKLAFHHFVLCGWKMA